MGNKPRIRFKGFNDDWEQRKLDSLGKIITGNTPSTSKKEYWSPNSDGVVWITPTDINSVKTQCSERLLTKDGASQARIVPANSILVTCIASIGKNTINTVEAAFNQQINALVPHFSNSYFILTMLNNMESAFKRVAGTSATSIINKKEFGQLSALLPEIEEQNKIGRIFELIDNNITLHQCKLEKLKLTKKALLQKLFPKNGKRIPEIRFKGFTDAWEQRNLESLFTKYEDKVKTPNSGYWRLGLRSHCKGTFHTYVDAGNELETAEMNRVQSGNFILNITFAWERALAVTNEEDQDKLVSHRFPQFKPNSDLAIDFFKHTLIDKRFKHHLELSSPGGAGRNKVLKIADMLKYELLVPSIKEQNEISSFLNNVDYIITLYQRKLDRLISIKKALLQQLFV